jgi:hypothetical protein
MTARTPALCLLLALAACDPVHDDAVAALGGEQGGHPGPTHRPGQPCLLCHDGALGDPQEFSVAGTVFLHLESETPAQGATVELHDANDKTFDLVTNRGGNFYISPDQYRPAYPVDVKVRFQGETVTMHSLIGRDGSCAGCHVDPPGPDSPGRVYVQLEDGGVPP